jgi:hypothetical protein
MTKRYRHVHACILAAFWFVAVTAYAQTFAVLHTFDGSDGSSPGPLVQGVDGNLYGTTFNGGANSAGTTKGRLQVVVPSATLGSKLPFRVE